MYARTNSLVLPVLANDFLQKNFAYRPIKRSTEPEIFTFEEVLSQQQQRNEPTRHRKTRRVMYPSNVRMYLPPTEKSLAKRCLAILCVVLLLQIYAEEPYEERLSETDSPISNAPSEDFAFSQSQLVSLDNADKRSVEGKIENFAAEWPQTGYSHQEKHLDQCLDTTCPSSEATGSNTMCANWNSEVTGSFVQSSRTCYMMGLIYPVYRRLGGM